MKRAFACIGFGPSSAGLTVLIGGSGTPVSRSDYPAGVFAQLPTRGVIYWDPHAFNLTKTDGVMHASLNYEFTGDRRYALTGLADFSAIFRPNAPPFTRETYCNDSVVPRGARLFNLSTHTHKHGKHTWVTLADGTQIYENFSYTDPVQQRFGGRRATRHVDVDRDDAVTAADHGVGIVVVATAVRTGAH